jgi:starvation-inducible outer membrane lipoprotein
MKIKTLFPILLTVLFVLSACQSQPTANSVNLRSASSSQTAFSPRKGPYTGPVSLKINQA